MAMIRCGYCGKYYDDGYTGALDNGCPARNVSPMKKRQRRKRQKKNEKTSKRKRRKEGKRYESIEIQ